MNRIPPPRLIVTRGLPASGKTTWAKQMVDAAVGQMVRANRDDLRLMLDGRPLHTGAAERRVSIVQQTGVAELLYAGVDVIVDDTNLRAKYVRGWAEIAARYKATFEVVDFTDVDVDECVRRDSERAVPVGEDVIRSMHLRYLAGRTLPLPVPDVSRDSGEVTSQPYVRDTALPLAVMVDIDGTVALHKGIRDPYDTSRYHLDVPNQPVIDAVQAMYITGYQVVLCSGRDDTYRAVTEEWLAEHLGFPFAALHMRRAEDRRPDDVVKLELFDAEIRDRWCVTCVFDDRDRVVRAWRRIGLTVMQVADGAF